MHPQAQRAREACVKAGIPVKNLRVRTSFEWKTEKGHGSYKQYGEATIVTKRISTERLVELTPKLLENGLSVLHLKRGENVSCVILLQEVRPRFETIQLEEK